MDSLQNKNDTYVQSRVKKKLSFPFLRIYVIHYTYFFFLFSNLQSIRFKI